MRTKDKKDKVTFWSYLKNLLFPRKLKCIFCAEELSDFSNNNTCEECINKLPYIKNACERCGGELLEGLEGVCYNCFANNFNFENVRSVFSYDDNIVNLIHKFKYSGRKFLASSIAEYMSLVLTSWNIKVDLITSVPLHENREKERGYNQSKLLAENIAKKHNLDYKDLCVKIVDNPAQATLDAKSRRENVKGAYTINKDFKNIVKDKTILLIDDIYTTGSTSSEVSGVLKSSGAKKVYVLTFAHAVMNNDEKND